MSFWQFLKVFLSPAKDSLKNNILGACYERKGLSVSLVCEENYIVGMGREYIRVLFVWGENIYIVDMGSEYILLVLEERI